jgi:hypothetical protein
MGSGDDGGEDGLVDSRERLSVEREEAVEKRFLSLFKLSVEMGRLRLNSGGSSGEVILAERKSSHLRRDTGPQGSNHETEERGM